MSSSVLQGTYRWGSGLSSPEPGGTPLLFPLISKVVTLAPRVPRSLLSPGFEGPEPVLRGVVPIRRKELDRGVLQPCYLGFMAPGL